MAVMETKKVLFSITGPNTFDSTSSIPVNSLVGFFVDKVSLIPPDFDVSLSIDPVLDVSVATSCQNSTDSFRLVSLNDADRMLGAMKSISCKQDPCLSWLLKA